MNLFLIGGVDDCERDLCEQILCTGEEYFRNDKECRLYINSSGGELSSALAIVAAMQLKRLTFHAIVLGDCHSGALLPFAACTRRWVKPWSTFLFHGLQAGMNDNSPPKEIMHWAEHLMRAGDGADALMAAMFGVDRGLIEEWSNPGRYVTAQELADAGLAEIIGG